MFSRAKQTEILRSSQKDEYFTSTIKSALGDILQNTASPRHWLKWSSEYELLGDVVYFLLTTFGGYQTLGEEYVNIILTKSTLRNLPSKVQRAVMIFVQCCVPYLFEKCLTYLEKRVDNDRIEGLTPQGKAALKQMIPAVRHAVLIIHRCNLAVFYLKGIFYHFSKRLTNIHYILVRPDSNQHRSSNYKILGWLCAVQLIWIFIQQFSRLARKLQQRSSSSHTADEISSREKVEQFDKSEPLEVESNGQVTCPLCLERRIRSTCTPCGHLFCWTCIHEWVRSNPACPLCRQPFEASRLVCLRNYDFQ